MNLIDFSVIAYSVLLLNSCAPSLKYIFEGECENNNLHGSFTLKSAHNYMVSAKGNFSNGKKNGKFEFFSSSGHKTIELYYKDDQINGVILMWYHPLNNHGRNVIKKMEAEYINGKPHGNKTSLYLDGRKRSACVYNNGKLIRAEFWDERGIRLSNMEAEKQAKFDLRNDQSYYSKLENRVNISKKDCSPINTTSKK